MEVEAAAKSSHKILVSRPKKSQLNGPSIAMLLYHRISCDQLVGDSIICHRVDTHTYDERDDDDSEDDSKSVDLDEDGQVPHGSDAEQHTKDYEHGVAIGELLKVYAFVVCISIFTSKCLDYDQNNRVEELS